MAQIRDKKLLQHIALVIKELRVDMGYSQESVYNDTNIHIARIETATYNVSISTLSSLLKYFDIKMSDFFLRVEKSMKG